MKQFTAQDRLDAVSRVIEKNESVVAVSRDIGISRKTFYAWLKRFQEAPQQEKVLFLKDRRQKQKDVPLEFSPELARKIVEIVKERPEYETQRIAHELKRRHNTEIGNQAVQDVLNKLQ